MKQLIHEREKELINARTNARYSFSREKKDCRDDHADAITIDDENSDDDND